RHAIREPAARWLRGRCEALAASRALGGRDPRAPILPGGDAGRGELLRDDALAPMAVPVLWQFRFSHFNEKARWALDWKRVPHTRSSLLPGWHFPQILWM